MIKKSMKNALSSSLRAEEQAVENRFARAELVFAEKKDNPQELQQPEHKDRVIRDSFTLPNEDYKLIAGIKSRCLKLGVNITKSEAIRAGLHALNELSNEDLLTIVDRLSKVKTGRPTRTGYLAHTIKTI